MLIMCIEILNCASQPIPPNNRLKVRELPHKKAFRTRKRNRITSKLEIQDDAN
jgi:hypothetical protein